LTHSDDPAELRLRSPRVGGGVDVPAVLFFCHPERAEALAEATRDQREAICPKSAAMKSYRVYIMSGRTRTF